MGSSMLIYPVTLKIVLPLSGYTHLCSYPASQHVCKRVQKHVHTHTHNHKHTHIYTHTHTHKDTHSQPQAHTSIIFLWKDEVVESISCSHIWTHTHRHIPLGNVLPSLIYTA